MAEQKQEPPKTRYRCPFHPEVASDEPKRCYKCGMNLESFQTTNQ